MTPPILQAIADRRSTRDFLDRPVEVEKIEAMLEAGRLAPAANGLSHVRVLVAEGGEEREVLRRAAYSFGAMQSAPLALLLMADRSIEPPYVEMINGWLEDPTEAPIDLAGLRSGGGRPFQLKVALEWAMMSVAIAGEHMMLQAVEMGLAGCWVHHFDHDDVREYLKLPDNMALVSLMAIGYASERPPATGGRTPLRWQPEGLRA